MQRAGQGRGRTAAILLVLSLAVVLAVVAAVGTADEAGAHRASARDQLAELRVRPAGSMAGYSREKFVHWSDATEYGWTLPAGTPDPESCDARDAALIRDGRGEVVRSGCHVERGTWLDPYTGRTYHSPSDIDIDHVVALGNAWRSGASSWTAPRRERFANVPMDVLSVEDNANQSKGDSGPEAWKPPRPAYHCTYARKWIGIKHNWSLSVTRPEKSALSGMLSTC